MRLGRRRHEEDDYDHASGAQSTKDATRPHLCRNQTTMESVRYDPWAGTRSFY